MAASGHGRLASARPPRLRLILPASRSVLKPAIVSRGRCLSTSAPPPSASDIDNHYALNIPLARAVAASLKLKSLAPKDAPPPPPADGLYRRPLPENLIAFSSSEGKKLFREALAQGYMEGYFALAEQFHTQQDPAYCGLATLAMCLNALKIDPERIWKGPWRWFSEDMLDCCTPIEVVRKRGITFAEFGCLAKCNGSEIRSFRADHSTEQHFRESIKHATSVEHLHLVCSYARESLGQTGVGHYSPIGGYHADRDLALVLDVARFKYDPHWVPVSTLWEAMRVIDEATGLPRGYCLLSTGHPTLYPLIIARFNGATYSSWHNIDQSFSKLMPAAMEAAAPTSVDNIAITIASTLPPELGSIDITAPEPGSKIAEGYNLWKEKLLSELATTEMFRLVQRLGEAGELPRGVNLTGLTLLLLSCPSQIYSKIDPSLREKFEQLRVLDLLPQVVRGEVIRMREQLLLLSHKCKRKTRKEQAKEAVASLVGSEIKSGP